MIRQPIRTNTRERKQVAIALPCPVGGLNVRDNVAAMPISDAIEMDNFIPYETYVEQRAGYKKLFNTENIGVSLIAYNNAKNPGLIYGGGGALYKFNPLTTQEPDILKGGFIGNNWQGVLYKQRLFLVNGQDLPQVYDGETVEELGIYVSSGQPLNLQDLYLTTIFKNRLFFAQDNSLSIWYMKEAGNIAGEILELDLNELSRRGGKIAAIANWTQQGGQGQDNLLVVITSEGECFVYDGSDPSDIDAWTLRGIYNMPRVVGINNNTQLAGNVIVITENGYYPLSNVLSQAFASTAVAFSDKINGEFLKLNNSFAYKDWQIEYFSSKDLMIINVPITPSKSIQHVMNCRTGAWCRFSAINIKAMAQLNNNIYFCGYDNTPAANPAVFKLFEGSTDDGKPIECHCRQAFTDFGYKGLKRWNTLQIALLSKAKISFQMSFGIDYGAPTVFNVKNEVHDQSLWDEAIWDVSKWESAEDVYTNRIILSGVPGIKGSIGVKVYNDSVVFKWLESFITFESNGYV
jgi:hypothetical protein